MNIIEQKRQSIMENSSTASGKRELLDVLENLLPTIDELVFKEPMHGDIDFSVLTECGFNNITSIVFETGDVTNIRNLPNHITRIDIVGNLLTHLEDLPESLVDLNVSDNGIKRLDISALKHLKSLNIANNELVELILTPSIETLHCQNNKLVELDLEGMDTLHTLNCNGNPLLSITHFQDTIQNFIMENNPAVEIRRSMGKDDDEYQQNKINVEAIVAIHKFFELKKEYEENLREKKRVVYEREKEKRKSVKEIREIVQNVKIPCLHCGQVVNNSFTISDRTYRVKCGNTTNPCNLNIEIYAGKYMDMKYMLNYFKKTVEEERENIIKVKMNSLLNYTSEKSSVKEFKNIIEEYNEILGFLQNAENDYNELYFNQDTNEKIKQKKARIFELQERMRKMLDDYKEKKHVDKNRMADIMLFYKDELLPEYNNLQELKYPFKDIETKGEPQKPTFIVIQKSIGFNRVDYNYSGKEANVVSYTQ